MCGWLVRVVCGAGGSSARSLSWQRDGQRTAWVIDRRCTDRRVVHRRYVVQRTDGALNCTTSGPTLPVRRHVTTPAETDATSDRAAGYPVVLCLLRSYSEGEGTSA